MMIFLHAILKFHDGDEIGFVQIVGEKIGEGPHIQILIMKGEVALQGFYFQVDNISEFS